LKINPEREEIENLAKIILTAARTAPKARGQDDIVTAIVEDRESLARKMEEVAEEKGAGFEFFKRDAQNVRDSDSVLLIGLKGGRTVELKCSACGYECDKILRMEKKETDFVGPNCGIKLTDLGIAIGAAVAKAKDLCVDNRVMYTIGAAARRMKLIEADVIMGLPLSVKGKNIFVDRK
jgi:uncharacterized ferredoxin-like protein